MATTALPYLPESPRAIYHAMWDDILPYYDALASRPLTAETADAWLRDWSTLEEMLRECAATAHVASTTDTADAAKEADEVRWSSTINPKIAEQQTRLARRILDLGYERADLVTTLRRFRNTADLFREENVPLKAQLSRLDTEYNRITGGLTVQWDGAEKTIPQLRPYQLSPDRAIRERAFRSGTEPYITRRDALADLFDRQYALRQQVARNADFTNYRDYMHREKNRFDYTPADCAQFHAAVVETVVPALTRIYARRATQLGLDRLRPWDAANDPAGRAPLHPFTDADALIAGGRRIFAHLDPTLGGYFDQMADAGLLDLDSRKGKRPGGYCTSFPYRGLPFIFMNAVGVATDVDTLLHEAGHAFHNFEARQQPLIFQRHPGSEMAEVASMSMELLTAPYLAEEAGGYYTDADARRARAEHLEGILASLAHIATIDAFQQWVYTDPDGANADARDAAWVRIFDRFNAGLDYDGLRAEKVSRWYRQLHVFLYPFYYIEYGIAQIGALQVWRNSKANHAEALAAYRRALALGATKPLPELFAAAGAQLAFDTGTIAPLVRLVEDELTTLVD